MTKTTTKRKKRNFAMPAAAEAIPPNPKSAATSAMTRKTTAQYSIGSPSRERSDSTTYGEAYDPSQFSKSLRHRARQISHNVRTARQCRGEPRRVLSDVPGQYVTRWFRDALEGGYQQLP